MIDGYVKFANSSDDAYAHIDAKVRQKTQTFLCIVIDELVMRLIDWSTKSVRFVSIGSSWIVGGVFFTNTLSTNI